MSVVERNQERREDGILGRVTVWGEEGGDRAGLN